MYGKHYSSMYTGSMVGSGALAFAVMGYVIANAVPDREVGTQVELNPTLLAVIIGEPEVEVEKAIQLLCEPDPKSRTKAEGGRRLIRLGQFDYQVVNGAKYRAIRDEEARRAQNRDAKRRQREKESSGASRNGDHPPYPADCVTPQQRAAFTREYNQRRKREAQCAGAQAAISDGFADQERAGGANGPAGPEIS